MRKYTQKELKNLVSIGAVNDITNFGFDQMTKFLHLHTLDRIGYSSGVYGINGGLVKDRNTGALYAITRRNSTLFMAF